MISVNPMAFRQHALGAFLLANVLSILLASSSSAQQTTAAGAHWTPDERAKMMQADSSIQTLEQQRAKEIADLQKARTAAQSDEQQILNLQKAPSGPAHHSIGNTGGAQSKLKVLTTELGRSVAIQKQGQNQLETTDKWIQYWQGQKQQVQWNISQDRQMVEDQHRAQEIQAQSLADQEATREGHQYYAPKLAENSPSDASFGYDGWTCIPICTP